MPCDARVVLTATVSVDINKMLRDAAVLGIPVFDQGSKTIVKLSQQVTAEILPTGNCVLRSTAFSWDEGVEQLKKAVNYLEANLGVMFKDIGQPETHLHDHPAPWQRQGVR